MRWGGGGVGGGRGGLPRGKVRPARVGWAAEGAETECVCDSVKGKCDDATHLGNVVELNWCRCKIVENETFVVYHLSISTQRKRIIKP